jgi:hypothetical protein
MKQLSLPESDPALGIAPESSPLPVLEDAVSLPAIRVEPPQDPALAHATTTPQQP